MSKKKARAAKRRNRSDEEKDRYVRLALEHWARRPTDSMNEVAAGLDLVHTVLRKWLNEFGGPYGWRGSSTAIQEELRENPEARSALLARVKVSALVPNGADEPETAPEPPEQEDEDEGVPEQTPPTAAPDSASPEASVGEPSASWLARHGAQLRLAMGLSEEDEQDDEDEDEDEDADKWAEGVLPAGVSPIERQRRQRKPITQRGQTLLSRPVDVEEQDVRIQRENLARESEERDALVTTRERIRDYPPRRAFLQRPGAEQQLDPAEFHKQALTNCLRERDALIVALKIVLREEQQ